MDSFISKAEEAFRINPDVLRMRLSTLSNGQLVKQFKDFFERVGEYQPQGTKTQIDFEETQLLELSKVFKEEIVDNRLYRGSVKSVLELIQVIQGLMKKTNFNQLTYYERNLLRIYARCIKLLRKRGYDKKYIKEVVYK